MRRWVPLVCCVAFGFACASRPAQPKVPTTEAAKRNADRDAVLLRSGTLVEGKIVERTEAGVAVETEKGVRLFPARDVAEISLARPAPAVPVASTPSPSPDRSLPPQGWLPRTDPSEPLQHVEITFFADHPWSDCLGSLTRAVEQVPELDLFIEPGSRLVLHDPKQWGYHAHLFPGDLLHRPHGKPGLDLPLPASVSELPSAVAFVSPAQEIRPVDSASPRRSYTPPDALYARLRPLGEADVHLQAQPFSGGTPVKTPLGSLWVFSLPRNDRQFVLYLLDPEKHHSEVLREAFAAYGDSILSPDLMIDLVASDGRQVGRILVLPLPPSLSADGPAPLPVSVLAGENAAFVASTSVPPRQALLLPSRSASTRADVQLSFYGVSQDVRERIVVAHGTGRPSDDDVVARVRDLVPSAPDERVAIDVSGLPAERFPVVAWLTHRRSYVWSDGGLLPPPVSRAAANFLGEKPTKAISNVSLPHVLPLFFRGPEPSLPSDSNDLAEAAVAGGMQSAFLRDVLGRGLGEGVSTSISNLMPRAAPDSSSGSPNVTNIYITIPPHAPAGTGSLTGPAFSVFGGGSGGGSRPTGPYLRNTTGEPILADPSSSLIGPWNTLDPSTGKFSGPGGTAPYGTGTYNAKNGSLGKGGMSSSYETTGYSMNASGVPSIHFRRRDR